VIRSGTSSERLHFRFLRLCVIAFCFTTLAESPQRLAVVDGTMGARTGGVSLPIFRLALFGRAEKTIDDVNHRITPYADDQTKRRVTYIFSMSNSLFSSSSYVYLSQVHR